MAIKMETPLDKLLAKSRVNKSVERNQEQVKQDAAQERFDKMERILVETDLPECVDLEITEPEFPEDPLGMASYGCFRLTIHGSTSMYMYVRAFDDKYETSVGWNMGGSQGEKKSFDEVLEQLAGFIADNEPIQS